MLVVLTIAFAHDRPRERCRRRKEVHPLHQIGWVAVGYLGKQLTAKVAGPPRKRVLDLEIGRREQEIHDEGREPERPAEGQVMVGKHVVAVAHHAERDAVFGREFRRRVSIEIVEGYLTAGAPELDETVRGLRESAGLRMIAVPHEELDPIRVGYRR